MLTPLVAAVDLVAEKKKSYSHVRGTNKETDRGTRHIRTRRQVAEENVKIIDCRTIKERLES